MAYHTANANVNISINLAKILQILIPKNSRSVVPAIRRINENKGLIELILLSSLVQILCVCGVTYTTNSPESNHFRDGTIVICLTFSTRWLQSKQKNVQKQYHDRKKMYLSHVIFMTM